MALEKPNKTGATKCICEAEAAASIQVLDSTFRTNNRFGINNAEKGKKVLPQCVF